jgi:large subunit ribosomal protein L25
MATVTIAAMPRDGRKKGAARRLRAVGRIPAVLYGLGEEPIKLSFGDRDFRKAISTGSGTRAVLKFEIEGSGEKVAILREIQRHPVNRNVVHADLLAIDLTQPVDVAVPVSPIGVPVGVRLENGVLGWARRELNIRVLPTAIPETIEIDIEELHVNSAVHIEDIAAEGFEILDDPELTICSVASVSFVEEETTEEVEGEAAEAEGAEDGATEEDGAAPAEGDSE